MGRLVEDDFNGHYLYQQTQSRKTTVKQLLMDHHVVVGIGNIYANETLFAAKIDPRCPALRLGLSQCKLLVRHSKKILQQAINQGGTTLKDFFGADNKPGYFSQQLKVYGRANQPCLHCGTAIRYIRQQQRASYYCPICQFK